eukprot:m.40720 g.40720  ORF g.40720 m.40720 type:complete len:190 (+) comp9699_c0_seq2:242-811(+)
MKFAFFAMFSRLVSHTRKKLRSQSLRRLQFKMEEILEKYNDPFESSEVLDLETGRIHNKKRGFLRSIRATGLGMTLYLKEEKKRDALSRPPSPVSLKKARTLESCSLLDSFDDDDEQTNTNYALKDGDEDALTSDVSETFHDEENDAHNKRKIIIVGEPDEESSEETESEEEDRIADSDGDVCVIDGNE